MLGLCCSTKTVVKEGNTRYIHHRSFIFYQSVLLEHMNPENAMFFSPCGNVESHVIWVRT